MTRRSLFHLVSVLTVAGVIAAARGAEACSCAGQQPACSAFWDDGAVFAGRVLGIDRATTGDRPVRVSFAVLEAFKGVTTAEVDVVTDFSIRDPRGCAAVDLFVSKKPSP
jgi:hypothetical protein